MIVYLLLTNMLDDRKKMISIVINATAAKSSGALTILKDFMSYVYTLNENKLIFYLITTTNGVFRTKRNVVVTEIPSQNWCTRLVWDRSGLQKWCEKNDIIPNIAISFQNTCSRFRGKYKNVKWLVYYHQSLPLIKYKWKLQHKDERKLFLYARFYGLFVNRWNKNADYVVQLPYIKQLFCKKFKNINSDRVHIIRPNLPKIDIISIKRKSIDEEKKVFIYPAIPVRYKNHKVILDAVEMIRNENSMAIEKLEIVFTIPNNSIIANEVKKRNLDSIIKCIGCIPYEELLTYYKRCNGLLFPSEIETFGLPLIEAAMFGKPIIAADLPYSREVLAEYEGVMFENIDCVDGWKQKILSCILNENEYPILVQKEQNTWNAFFGIIEETFCKM